jgi:transcriptional regulator with XRE-family HTH domain
MHIGERIRQARTARGPSQGDVAERIGVGQTTVSSWEKGRTEPSREMVQKIADFLRMPIAELEGVAPEGERRPYREIPIISWVSAGQLKDPGQLAPGRYAKHMLVDDLPGGEYVATDVRGDSMDRISPEGSRIIIDINDREPKPGKFYVFSLRGETTFKRFRSEPVIRFEPFSTNPANEPIFPKADRDWQVVGRVVRSYLNLDTFSG